MTHGCTFIRLQICPPSFVLSFARIVTLIIFILRRYTSSNIARIKCYSITNSDERQAPTDTLASSALCANMAGWSTTRSNPLLLGVSTSALVSSSRYFLAYRMNYPVEGAEKSPTIHERQRIHRIPAVPSLKDNNDDNDDRTATRIPKMTSATSTG